MIKPTIFLPATAIEVIMPKGTSSDTATRAAGRIIEATKAMVASPMDAHIEVNDMWTCFRFDRVEQLPLVVDARDLLYTIGRAAEKDDSRV